MIDERVARKYCKEDISKIKNYELAIADTTQTWQCHHILGEILTRQQLLEHEFYYNVPACMLKFVTKSEHNRLHKKKHFSEESRKNISEAHKGKTPFKGHYHSEDTKKKMSEAHKGKSSPMKGKHLSEETKQKLSKVRKGKTWKFIDGKRVWLPKEGNE